mmetsp:Transcript_25602/g.45468  ORF Transcript_25602/g.45468 Transcript_25602/m.45468 type:complete len:269 (+) Transcript_25602:76-882(+)
MMVTKRCLLQQRAPESRHPWRCSVHVAAVARGDLEAGRGDSRLHGLRGLGSSGRVHVRGGAARVVRIVRVLQRLVRRVACKVENGRQRREERRGRGEMGGRRRRPGGGGHRREGGGGGRHEWGRFRRRVGVGAVNQGLGGCGDKGVRGRAEPASRDLDGQRGVGPSDGCGVEQVALELVVFFIVIERSRVLFQNLRHLRLQLLHPDLPRLVLDHVGDLLRRRHWPFEPGVILHVFDSDALVRVDDEQLLQELLAALRDFVVAFAAHQR